MGAASFISFTDAIGISCFAVVADFAFFITGLGLLFSLAIYSFVADLLRFLILILFAGGFVVSTSFFVSTGFFDAAGFLDVVDGLEGGADLALTGDFDF